jgi:hypothetical protein
MIGNREEALRQQPDESFDGELGGMGHSLEVLFTFASLQSNFEFLKQPCKRGISEDEPPNTAQNKPTHLIKIHELQSPVFSPRPEEFYL